MFPPSVTEMSAAEKEYYFIHNLLSEEDEKVLADKAFVFRKLKV